MLRRRFVAGPIAAAAVAGRGHGGAMLSGNLGGEDVVFVHDMLRQIEGDLCLDTTQRLSIGFSYGGGMGYALACARPDVFRAVAVQPSPGTLGGGTEPIAHLAAHGIGDSGGSGRSLRDRFVRNNGYTAAIPHFAAGDDPAAGGRGLFRRHGQEARKWTDDQPALERDRERQRIGSDRTERLLEQFARRERLGHVRLHSRRCAIRPIHHLHQPLTGTAWRKHHV